jgi:putative endonuclease
MRRQYFVYILTNQAYGTLYVGVTNDLVGRIWEHRCKAVKGFTQEHGLDRLVWYEIHEDPYEAITREKRIKKWNRDWKVNLIQRMNPGWNDLYEAFMAAGENAALR